MSGLFGDGRPRVNGVLLPTDGTLARYGLTREEWVAMLAAQGHVCPICGRVSGNERLNTDHEHVPGWKYLSAEERRLYVRGLLCVVCNGNIAGWRLTLEKARNLVKYLEAYEARRPAPPAKPPRPKRRRK